MSEAVGRAVVSVLTVLALGTGTGPRDLQAQEGQASCDRLSVGSQQQVTADGITFLWRNFTAGCGDARMSSDSAVVRERAGVLLSGRLIRGVRYQDSTRSLTSDSLVYSGADDRVTAMGNVVLTMRKSGIRLAGPWVEFHRLTRSGAERTIATERPQLTLEGEPGSGDPPTTIDADRMEIFREDNAWYYGEVVIRRPDASSFADSAFFDMVDETGILYGEARVEGEEFELRGDSIRLVLTNDALRSVHAFGDAEASGTDFEVASAEIRVGFFEGEVEQVEAFGRRGAALSGGYHLLGDSLRFKFREGAMDSTFAVGTAVAVEDTTAGLGDEPRLSVDGDNGWLAGDTIVASFRHLVPPPDSAVAGQADSAAADAQEAPGSELEKLRTVGNARAFYVATDTTADGPAGRNYLIGSQIAIFFEDDRAVRVAADQAIGVYLDPDPNAPPLPQSELPVADGDSAALAPDGRPDGDDAPAAAEQPEEEQAQEGDGEVEEGDGEVEAEEPKDLRELPRQRPPGDS